MARQARGRAKVARTTRAVMVTLACAIAGVLLIDQRLAAEEIPKTKPAIPWKEAKEHIGENVTIEGRIVATYRSSLSTLLSFDKGFNQFTAVIHAADRAAFPENPEEHYRSKWVRVTGRVIEYEKKAEIVLKSRSQIEIVEATKKPAQAPHGETVQLTLEVLRRLTQLEENLQSMADRLDLILALLDQQAQPESPAVYLVPGASPSVDPPPRPRSQALRTIKRGMSASQVERLMGIPLYIDTTSEGGEIWYYGGGRTVSFNRRGRIEATAGFQRN